MTQSSLLDYYCFRPKLEPVAHLKAEKLHFSSSRYGLCTIFDTLADLLVETDAAPRGAREKGAASSDIIEQKATYFARVSFFSPPRQNGQNIFLYFCVGFTCDTVLLLLF